MIGSRRRAMLLLPAVWALGASTAVGTEPVALRLADRRFIAAATDGSIRNDRRYPSRFETFDLAVVADGQIALKAHTSSQ